MINLVVNKFANIDYLFLPNCKSIKYSINITNTGDEPAYYITVTDIISNCASLNFNTVLINGCNQSCFNPPGKILIPCLDAGATVTITIDGCINKNCIPDEISNTAYVSFKDLLGNYGSAQSNTLTIPVINLDVCLIKSVDKMVATVGEILNYYILLRNLSNIEITDVSLTDILPSCLELIPASLKVNNETIFPSDLNPLKLGTIPPKSNVVIVFQAKINSMCYPSSICNTAKVDYSYTIISNNIPINSIGQVTSCPVVTKVLNTSCC